MLVSPLVGFLTDIKNRGEWVQLSGHQGNFLPGRGGTICKKWCEGEKITYVAHPFKKKGEKWKREKKKKSCGVAHTTAHLSECGGRCRVCFVSPLPSLLEVGVQSLGVLFPLDLTSGMRTLPC